MERNAQKCGQSELYGGNKEGWPLWSEAIGEYTEGTAGTVWETVLMGLCPVLKLIT